MPPWTAECAVTDELAGSLIETQFPELAPVTIRPMGEGWDHRALLVNDQFMFRFPRRQVGADSLQGEIRVLPGLAPLLPLPIPVPTFIGKPDRGYPWIFAGYRKLEGRTACSVALDDDTRQNLAEPLAQFLVALHAIDVETALRLGALPDSWNRSDLSRKAAHIRDRLDQLLQFGIIRDVAPYLDLVANATTARVPRAMSMVHGDLYVRHLLLDRNLRLSGVIDWGDVHVGDVVTDLAVAHAILPPGAHDQFRRVYGPIDDESWRLARLHALYGTTILAVYGHMTGDADLNRETPIMLGHIVS